MTLPRLRRSLLVGTSLALLAGATGCLPYTRATPAAGERFQALYERRLSDFEQRLATERHTDAADAWTRVGEAWLALATCRPIEGPTEGPTEGAAEDSMEGSMERSMEGSMEESADEHLARLLLETLRLEERRRLAWLHSAAPSRQPLLAVAVLEADFFARGANAAKSRSVVWPSEEESWADELPAAVDVPADCDVLRAARTGAKAELLVATLDDTDRALRAADRLDPTQLQGNVAALAWRLRLHAGVTAARLAHVAEDLDEELDEELDESEEAEEAGPQPLDPSALRARALAYLAPLANDPAPVGEAARAPALLLEAALRAEQGNPALALARLDRALDLGLTSPNLERARYLRLRLKSEAGDWPGAVAAGDPAPPQGSALHAAHVYHYAMALLRSGADDRFMQVAMEALRERRALDGPFGRALYVEVLARLAEFAFDPRVVELVEELGPRVRTYARLEELARVALDRGRPDNASAAARWLLAADRNHRAHPRYYGLLALAAFSSDDQAAFRDHVGRIAERPADLLAALPDSRRARFFAHADVELARVLRQTLPAMAEWGDGAAAQRRRERWLTVVVEATQEFLRGAEASVARPSLVELYRLASGLLAEHPRGYAERVGAGEPAPLVLGNVRVDAAGLNAHEPQIQVEILAPASLTLVPRDDAPPTSWSFGWPAVEEVPDA